MERMTGVHSYRYQTAGQIVSGRRSLERLSDHMETLPRFRKALVLSQPSISRSGYLELVVRQLQEAGIACDCCLDIKPEPAIDNIDDVYAQYGEEGYDLVVGIGGGSVLDAAKILSVMPNNAMPVREMIGVDKIARPGVPTVLIPTTSGTGSEVTPNAIVTLPEQELKIGIVSRHLLPRLVVIDPLITVGLPQPITAATGMDAFTHAFESFISNKANPFSDMFALEAIRKISGSIEAAYHEGDNVQAREDMLLGSMYGGMALSCAGTAAVHALAYPLGGKFNIPHGVANAMLLPHVTAFNLDAIAHRMMQAASAMGLDPSGRNSDAQAAEQVMKQIDHWTRSIHIPQNLRSYGVLEEHLPSLSVAASQVTRLMDNNPKKMTPDHIEAIYRKLLQRS